MFKVRPENLENSQNLLYLLNSFSMSLWSWSTATDSRLLLQSPVCLFSNSPMQKTIRTNKPQITNRTRVKTATMTSFSRKLFGDSVFWLEDPDCPWVVEMTDGTEEISLLWEFEVDIFITTVKSITKNITKIRITVNVNDNTIVLDYGCSFSFTQRHEIR